jgi:hypothetical protein
MTAINMFEIKTLNWCVSYSVDRDRQKSTRLLFHISYNHNSKNNNMYHITYPI